MIGIVIPKCILNVKIIKNSNIRVKFTKKKNQILLIILNEITKTNRLKPQCSIVIIVIFYIIIIIISISIIIIFFFLCAVCLKRKIACSIVKITSGGPSGKTLKMRFPKNFRLLINNCVNDSKTYRHFYHVNIFVKYLFFFK